MFDVYVDSSGDQIIMAITTLLIGFAFLATIITSLVRVTREDNQRRADGLPQKPIIGYRIFTALFGLVTVGIFLYSAFLFGLFNSGG